MRTTFETIHEEADELCRMGSLLALFVSLKAYLTSSVTMIMCVSF